MRKTILNKLITFIFVCILSLQPILSQKFTEQTGISLPGAISGSVAWGDYDNDGDLDILLTGAGSTMIYRNNGNNTFTLQSEIPLRGVAAWGDYNNDGYLDILITDPANSKIYKNNGDNTFTEQTGISLPGVSSSSIAWGDYDNDGDLDILIAGDTTYDNPITKIYRNNGDNTFTEQSGIILDGIYNGSVAWGDYNNDGYLDIALTGFTGVTSITKIYRNNGDNTFTEQTGISLYEASQSHIAWGDYDNDGFLDILLTGADIAKVYKNNGDNTFTETIGYLTGVTQAPAAWGDFDSDGDLDILLTGEQTPSYTAISQIWENISNNLFDQRTDILLTGVMGGAVAWGDYDNDGKLDFILTGNTDINSGTYVTKVYRNQYGTANTKPSAPANLKSTINSDGVTLSWDKATDTETPQSGLSYNIYVSTVSKKDNVKPCMSDISNGFRKVACMGNSGSITSYKIKNLTLGQTYYWSVQTVDNDFAGSNFAPEQSFVYQSQSTDIQASNIVLNNVSASAIRLTWTNGNGTRRAVFIKQTDTGTPVPSDNITYTSDAQFGIGSQIGSSGWYCVYNGDSNGVTITGLQAVTKYRIMVAEYKGNNGAEIYNNTLATNNPVTLTTSAIQQSASFQAQTGISLTGVKVSSVAWGDYNNDGFLDILLTGRSDSGSISKIFKNNGDNTFTEQTGITLTPVESGSVAWGDYNNDGFLDILLTGQSGIYPNYIPVSKIYKNNGDNTFTEQTGIKLTGVYESSVAWGDYNNDGLLDILLTGYTGSESVSKIYKNNGDNTFTEQTGIALTGVYLSSVDWGDYNNDGNPDILLTGYTGFLNISKIYKNNGDNTFTDQTDISLTGVSSGSAEWGDYDNDGNLDILLTGYNGSADVSLLYKNNGDNTFTEQTGAISSNGFVAQQNSGSYGSLNMLLTENKGYDGTSEVSKNFIDRSIIGQNEIMLTSLIRTSAAWGDYDNDGDLDILLTEYHGDTTFTSIIKNNGDGSFTGQPDIFLTPVYYSSVAWGDYNNDGKLDILLTGYDGNTGISKIYKNQSTTINTKPSIPSDLQSTVMGTEATLNWTSATDNETAQKGLTYNIYVSTISNKGNIINSMSSIPDGLRKTVKAGNSGNNTFYTVKNLAVGQTYYWSVQAVDNNFAGGAFAPEASFVATKADQTISFGILPDKKYGDEAFELTATAGSGLPVSYTSSNETVARVSGNIVTITGSGFTTITASQGGNDNYNAAPDVKQTLNVLATTGISDAITGSIRVYPNPGKDRLFIDSDIPLVRIQIINLTGETIMSEKVKTKNAEINISSLPEGVYLINIMSNDQEIVQRFMKR